jgi:nucleotide-binding universal stress UspA family protein
MYNKIMVPLDGSSLAECVFPHVEAITGGCHVSDVVFVRAVEPFVMQMMVYDSGYYFPQKQIDEIDARNEIEAKKYLGEILQRVKLEGARTEAVVLKGKPADAVAEYADKNGIDLIVVATHGRSGISRWVWGSVADRVLRSVSAPVMMIRSPGCGPNK